MKPFLKYYLFWILFFLVQKPLFMLFTLPQMGPLSWQDWFLVPFHSFPLDLSVASYVAAVFGLILTVFYLWPSRILARIADVITGILLMVALITYVGDLAVFPSWGFHLDKTVFIYLASPREVLACAETWQWFLGLFVLMIVWEACFALYLFWMRGWEKMSVPATWLKRGLCSFGMLLLTGLLFLPIRGSVTTSTMNTGRVYFSDKQPLNIAAINPLFNIVESLSENTFDARRYTYMPSDEAQTLMADLFPEKTDTIPSQRVLKTTRPDIVLFILESFSLNAWDAMPRLQELANEGLYFSHVEASSFRTDRGVVAILSAFPGQPTSSIMVLPAKSQNLPQIGKSLAAEGYKLKFWYGGDEDFTNMRSYLISGGFLDRVNDHSFPLSQRLSKWGVHDHLLFDKAASEITARMDTKPTLDVILSLSSHEPFEVPATKRFENPYLNSIAYTDSCIGAFADSLRQTPAWENTLLVFVADHGYPYPSNLQNHEPLRYAIPIVWAGGAVKEHQEIPTLCSQIDLVPTLLAQMDIDHSDYLFGKDILDTTSVPFAFYSFSDGFALLTEQDTVVVDAKANRCVMGDNPDTEQHARAFVQRIMEEIEKL